MAEKSNSVKRDTDKLFLVWKVFDSPGMIPQLPLRTEKPALIVSNDTRAFNLLQI